MVMEINITRDNVDEMMKKKEVQEIVLQRYLLMEFFIKHMNLEDEFKLYAVNKRLMDKFGITPEEQIKQLEEQCSNFIGKRK
jgi:tyrosine-protein phosphatase YwqE